MAVCACRRSAGAAPRGRQGRAHAAPTGRPCMGAGRLTIAHADGDICGSVPFPRSREREAGRARRPAPCVRTSLLRGTLRDSAVLLEVDDPGDLLAGGRLDIELEDAVDLGVSGGGGLCVKGHTFLICAFFSASLILPNAWSMSCGVSGWGRGGQADAQAGCGTRSRGRRGLRGTHSNDIARLGVSAGGGGGHGSGRATTRNAP